MNTFLNSNTVLPYINSSRLFFNSTLLSADLLNRFLIKPQLFRVLNNEGLFNLSVEFRFKLPFDGSFSKFKNRVHFLMYYLFFEIVVGQRPLVEVKKSRIGLGSLSKNKRDLKKLQLMIRQVDCFILKTSLFRFYEIDKFFNYIVFFLAYCTNFQTIVPSKLVRIDLETSKTAVSGTIKNLSLFNFFNLVDDLNGSLIEFRFRLFPFNPKNSLLLKSKSSILAFFSNSCGFFFKESFIDVKKIFNLRMFNFF